MRELRQTHQLKVVAGIESFAKRSTVRNIDDTAGLDKEELGIVYDKFYNVLYYRQRQQKGDRMDYDAFELFLGSLASWAKMSAEDHEADRERQLKVGKTFMLRLFESFDRSRQGSITLQVRVWGK